jgi:serine-type D-Ala-D-Ala carboxypeptidase/endopeptidase (penicillin-binding protein 4)
MKLIKRYWRWGVIEDKARCPLFPFYIFLFLLAALGTPDAKAQKIDSAALANFTDAVLELENSEILRHGTFSVCLKNTSDQRLIFGLNQERSLPSASTLKLITTSTALSVLGPDYRCSTFLEYAGKIVNDTLKGNLYIRGTGDPSLGSERFKEYPSVLELTDRWAAAVVRAGIRYVSGQVIADASYFDGNSVADSWIYADLGNYFGAGPGGLNIGENLYKIRFKPGRIMGLPAPVLGLDPKMPELRFQNFVTTGERGSGDQVTVYGTPENNDVVFRGTVPSGFDTFSVKGSMPDPPAYICRVLTTRLKASSIGVMGIWDSASISGSRKILDEYRSPPLVELCQQTNWWSINLYADALARLIGKRLAGKADYDGAVAAISSYWTNKNADMRGFYVKDGSGLSPSGSMTAQNLTEVLAVSTREKSFKDFYKSIAVLGQSGTVRNIGKGRRAAGNVRAKSGSIEGTRAYAGYVTTKSGSLLSFALIAHKYRPESSRIVSEELSKIMILLAEL